MLRLADVRSLAPQTDLFLHRYRGLLKERGGYLVGETPDNPGFFWGNFLFFPRAPRKGDLQKWKAIFREEFSHQPLVRHFAFFWDEQSEGDNAEFLKEGFQAEVGSVLALKKEGLLSPAKSADVSVRPLRTDAEWEAATRNQIDCRLGGWKLDTYTPFKRRQMEQYRRMVVDGHGHWWGAFRGEELVAECGLFFSGSVGRFQNVGTAPAHRRKGYCSAMVHAICAASFSENPSRTLVIVAEEGEPADFIYRSVGFGPAGRQHSLTWWPREEWAETPPES